ncbi:S8 family serine peptidase [Micromonospora arborensis]|uniref:S8 family serine peptidase n=1 Tax=Micromonospora arborensis TaxID=2116518 RepID=UPI0034030A9A
MVVAGDLHGRLRDRLLYASRAFGHRVRVHGWRSSRSDASERIRVANHHRGRRRLVSARDRTVAVPVIATRQPSMSPGRGRSVTDQAKPLSTADAPYAAFVEVAWQRHIRLALVTELRSRMRFRRGVGGGMAAAMLVVGTALAAASAASASPPPASVQSSAAHGPVRTVTLVTGDQVTMSPDGASVSAKAGPGRKGVTFTITQGDGRVRVVPSDAASLLAAKRLDPRLFDVTGLLEAGYDRPDHLPLIVTGGKGATATTTRHSIAGVGGLSELRDLPAVRGVAVRQSRGASVTSWRALTGGSPAPRSLRSGVGKVWLDGLRRPTLDVSVPQIGAPAAWQAGYTGMGSTVAVLDTGVDDTHPDLAGQVVGRQNFTEDLEPGSDLSGHGTHVAATIAGTGTASDGKFKGVAPGAKLLDGKVCTVDVCADSWIVAGMTWAAAEQHARVVNLSLGGMDDPEAVDPVEEAVQTLSGQYGTLFVIAAGNSDGGIVEGEISSPGTAPAALTVGAVDDTDALAGLSRRGPGPLDALKPDITAPGVGITAARGKDATRVPGNQGEQHTTLSGTSMATPHVAGAAAILAQRHAGWSGQQLKAALMATAQPTAGTAVYGQGAGRVDVARAVGQAVTTSPASISFGRQGWPHNDDPVLTREVTYHNFGSVDVTLDQRLNTFGADGNPSPDGMFTVSAATVMVPAGGEATVFVKADTRTTGPDGYAGGWLTATAGDIVVRTPLAVHKETESYDVTLKHMNRAGSSPDVSRTRLWRNDRDNLPYDTGYLFGAEGDSVTLRVPKGVYTLVNSSNTSGSGPKGSGGEDVLLAQPVLEVDRPRTVVLDGRLSQPISITVPESTAKVASVGMRAVAKRGAYTAATTILGTTFEGLYTARIGPDVRNEDFTVSFGGQWAKPKPDGTFDDSPYAYLLNFAEQGQMMTGYNRQVADRDLARVQVHFARANPNASTGIRRVQGGTAFPAAMQFQLPFTRTEYYNNSPDGWLGMFSEASDDGVLTSVTANSYATYKPGRTYREVWNKGVFGPALPPRFFFEGATRTGDTISVDIPLYSDGAGRDGDSLTESFSATLSRNGTKIGETDQPRFQSFAVSAADASYRLELRANRDPQLELSTTTRVAWEFRSSHVDSTTPAPLPLWTVRFSPRLDSHNTAPADRTVAVPVIATPQAGSRAGQLTNLTVEVSYDDGATWRAAPVQSGQARVSHPRGRGFVSLRAKVSDDAGNTVEQSIIRAYRYGS